MSIPRVKSGEHFASRCERRWSWPGCGCLPPWPLSYPPLPRLAQSRLLGHQKEGTDAEAKGQARYPVEACNGTEPAVCLLWPVRSLHLHKMAADVQGLAGCRVLAADV